MSAYSLRARENTDTRAETQAGRCRCGVDPLSTDHVDNSVDTPAATAYPATGEAVCDSLIKNRSNSHFDEKSDS
jgi:hypothetical protein